MILSCKYHQDLGDFESVVAKKLNSAMNKKEKTEMKNHIMNAVIDGISAWVQTRPYVCDVTCFHKQNESGEVIFTNFAFMPVGNVDVIWDTVTNVRETVDAIIDRISKIHDEYFRPSPISPFKPKSTRSVPEIEKVIFNDPATIIFWKDGTKTVVKCSEDDEFNPEVGMAMAISKKALGNKGNYCNEFKKWVEPYYEEAEEISVTDLSKLFEEIGERLSKLRFGRDIFKIDVGIDVSESKEKVCRTCRYCESSGKDEHCMTCISCVNRDGTVGEPFNWTPKD